MIYAYYGILAFTFFAGFALCIDKGMWSNTLMIINMLLSGLLAFGAYEPVATLAVEHGMEGYTFLVDFIMIWVVYIVAFLLLHRLASQFLSRTRMRFKNPIDTIGGPVTAGLVGWLAVCFVAATLHAAPFDEESFGGVLIHESGDSAITNPDLAWLSIAETALNEDNLGAGSGFDKNKFINDFRKQRAALEGMESLRNK